MKVLMAGSSGRDVRSLQEAVNARARRRGLDTVTVDGEYGPATDDAAAAVARALGALEATIKEAGCSVGEQRMIRWPSSRTPAQYARSAARKRAKPKPAAGPQKALAWGRRYVGKTEQPAGSNRAPWGLTDWQQALGSWLVGQAWCGVFVGTAMKHAGVKGVNSRCAAVVLILEDAINGRNGMDRVIYRRRTGAGSVAAVKPGDLVGLIGESTHVGMIEKRVPGGYQTLEGNTSPGTSGSQANGGGCWRRTRSDSAVVYLVRPDWS